MSKFKIIIIALSLFTTVTFAKDSLKVKKIEYYVANYLVKVENFDKTGRVISKIYFEKLSNNTDDCMLIMFDYFEGSKIISNEISYHFIISPDSTYYLEKYIGNAWIGKFDSTTNILNSKRYQVKLNKPKKRFYLDSLTIESKTLVVGDYQIQTYTKFDNQENVIEFFGDYGESDKRNYEYSYDSLNRNTLTKGTFSNIFIKRTNADGLSSYTFFEGTQTVEKICFDDTNFNSVETNEEYLNKKLVKKSITKNQYDSKKRIILEEEFEFEIKKNKAIGEPKLTKRKESIYRNNIVSRIIYEDFNKKEKKEQDIKYTFW